MRIEPMTFEQAVAYLNWTYDAPYAFYNTPQSYHAEILKEIFCHNLVDDYYSVLNDDGTIFGMYEYSFPGGIMEIGLGIHPNHCGGGNGRSFVDRCIAFGRENYSYAGPIRLMVADFNARAIHLYQTLGFAEVGRVDRVSYETPVTFIVMER